jgi:hypothetical protein
MAGVRVKKPFFRKVLEAALLIILLPIVLPLLLLGLVLHVLNKIIVYLLVWTCWLPCGKNVLFVSSDSPIWREYMESQILPLVRERAAVINWSERKQWPKWSLPVHVFRTFGRGRNYNPMVVVFHPLRRARVFRFLPAFTDFKHGNAEAVEQLRRELVLALGG